MFVFKMNFFYAAKILQDKPLRENWPMSLKFTDKVFYLKESLNRSSIHVRGKIKHTFRNIVTLKKDVK